MIRATTLATDCAEHPLDGSHGLTTLKTSLNGGLLSHFAVLLYTTSDGSSEYLAGMIAHADPLSRVT